jgi:hypothetical protein
MNEPNPDEITNEIAEIELSIGNIARVIQGQPAAQQGMGQQQQQQPGLIGTTEITIQGTTRTLDAIRGQLNAKSEQLRQNGYQGENKYRMALDALRTAQTPEDVLRIVSPVYKNGKVFGGKRTKKNRRKQKGGFIYKQQSKRRTISSSSTRRKRSSKSSNF